MITDVSMWDMVEDDSDCGMLLNGQPVIASDEDDHGIEQKQDIRDWLDSMGLDESLKTCPMCGYPLARAHRIEWQDDDDGIFDRELQILSCCNCAYWFYCSCQNVGASAYGCPCAMKTTSRLPCLKRFSECLPIGCATELTQQLRRDPSHDGFTTVYQAALAEGTHLDPLPITASIPMNPDPTAPMPGDLDGDGFVGSDDLNILLANWGQSLEPGSRFDPGLVDSDDLSMILANWGNTTSPVDGGADQKTQQSLAMAAASEELTNQISADGEVVSSLTADGVSPHLVASYETVGPIDTSSNKKRFNKDTTQPTEFAVSTTDILASFPSTPSRFGLIAATVLSSGRVKIRQRQHKPDLASRITFTGRLAPRHTSRFEDDVLDLLNVPLLT